MRVDDGWDAAYDTDFTAGGKSGDRPLVVSYATDPAADVVFSDGKKTTPTVGVVPGTCFAQVEFAGVLHGANNPAGAQALVDFMLTARVPGGHAAPDVRVSGGDGHEAAAGVHAVRGSSRRPTRWTRTRSARNRNAWIDEWTQIVLQ